jgi:hypothetical protein
MARGACLREADGKQVANAAERAGRMPALQEQRGARLREADSGEVAKYLWRARCFSGLAVFDARFYIGVRCVDEPG